MFFDPSRIIVCAPNMPEMHFRFPAHLPFLYELHVAIYRLATEEFNHWLTDTCAAMCGVASKPRLEAQVADAIDKRSNW